jgi:hypothetical protein
VSLFRFLILTLRNNIPFLFISRQFKPDMLTLALHMIVAHYKLDASLALKTLRPVPPHGRGRMPASEREGYRFRSAQPPSRRPYRKTGETGVGSGLG